MIKVEDIPKFLAEHNINPSLHRIKTFEYLVTHRNHPTVNMIYNDLSKSIPTLSKVTVYNSLKLFIREKIAIAITIEDNELRYDADVSPHGHFKCKVCGNVYDFMFKDVDMNNIGLDGFDIDQIQLYATGICKSCKETAQHN